MSRQDNEAWRCHNTGIEDAYTDDVTAFTEINVPVDQAMAEYAGGLAETASSVEITPVEQ